MELKEALDLPASFCFFEDLVGLIHEELAGRADRGVGIHNHTKDYVHHENELIPV
jgi:hypothetical protein